MPSKPQNLEKRPWGHFEDFYRSDEAVFKIITVDPGQRLSLQYHEKRDEVWVYLSGEGHAIVGKTAEALHQVDLSSNNRVIIERGCVHRLVNTGEGPLIIAEMQHGSCSEDDIVRISDDYGRIELGESSG